MLIAGLLGIAASLATELVKFINLKVDSFPPLRGKGAFLVALVAAVAGGAIKVFAIDNVPFTWTAFTASSAQIFAYAQIYFVLIADKLGLVIDQKNV